ncbi:hypothetical protein B7P43_G05452 [Cryptotermes secundus]|uniref:Uncharacterized protein n=1 Tax=Cryptotermes secundus TaxID=105785 RepID=A0A2J7QI93_9NEOP|nr:hypothetical protein B7P43_G05452 [Cryptotermes secundus]
MFHMKRMIFLFLLSDENIKLSEHIKQLEASLADTKRQLSEEKENWKSDKEKLKLCRSQEMEELKLSYEKRIMEAEGEVEDIKAKYHAQYSEFSKKLENIQNEKSNEINVIVFEYEERLHKMEERLNTAESESQKIRDRAAADVVLYQKKVLALEQQYNNMIRDKEESPLPLQSSSLESYAPGPATRNKSFQYHILSNINQNQPSRTPLRSALKKTTVYNSVQSSDKENILHSPSDFTDPKQDIGPGDGKPMECSTAKICAEACSGSPGMLSISTDRKMDESIVGTRSSIRPQLQFVTEPSDFVVVADVPLKQGVNPSTRGRRTRFAAAKKRKLFSSNVQDTL